MADCMKCGKPLEADEIGLHRKLFYRDAKEYMCIKCCSEYLQVSEEILKSKIEDFKRLGCTLFASQVQE